MHLVHLALSSWNTLLKREKKKEESIENAVWSCFHNIASPITSLNPKLLILLSHEAQRKEARSRYLWWGTWSKQGLKNEWITEFTLIQATLAEVLWVTSTQLCSGILLCSSRRLKLTFIALNLPFHRCHMLFLICIKESWLESHLEDVTLPSQPVLKTHKIVAGFWAFLLKGWMNWLLWNCHWLFIAHRTRHCL